MDIGITRSEVSSKEKEIPYDITYMWNLQYDTNKLIYETVIDAQTQRTHLWLPRERGAREGMEWEFESSRCKLLYIAWINNKILLYSTGNCIQYPMTNHNGKEF